MLERTLTSGECLRRQGIHTLFTHFINAAGALAADDSPGRQCTEMMSHVCVCQAYTCGVPSVAKNVRQIEMRWIVIAFISWALRLSIWGELVRKKKGFLSMREDILSNEGNWCTMAACKGGKISFQCAPTTLSQLFIILTWRSPPNSPPMAQGRLTVMQDLASHKLSA